MTSKLKTDVLETGSGSGTIALNNQLSGMTAASMPSGSVVKSVIIKDTAYVGSNSTSWVLAATFSITGVLANSKVQIEASINHLIENVGYGIFAIFKGSTELVRSVHNTAGMGSWTQALNTIYVEDTTPSVGTNTYTVKFYSTTAATTVFYNYNSNTTHAASFYKLTEIKG